MNSKLALWGVESIDEELDGQISENPLAAREYLTLMQSLDPELIEVLRFFEENQILIAMLQI